MENYTHQSFRVISVLIQAANLYHGIQKVTASSELEWVKQIKKTNLNLADELFKQAQQFLLVL